VIDLHTAVSAEFGGNQAHPGEVDSQFALLSAVQRPQITTFGRDAFPTFEQKAAVMITAIVQQCPFRGGNRRVALAVLIAFCALNGRSLDSRIFDEKTAETLLRRAGSYQDLGLRPEDVFAELRDVLGRAITLEG
jgi:death on curing protein